MSGRIDNRVHRREIVGLVAEEGLGTHKDTESGLLKLWLTAFTLINDEPFGLAPQFTLTYEFHSGYS